MKTVRLTMAQALVRYLSRAARRRRATASRCSPACSRSSATATSPASARRCTRTATRCRRIARTTSRRWRTRRSRSRRRSMRRRMMACTTSIGPGATNLVTAAATAHVNRLPVLLLPGDVFVSRAPDPVLQQIEDFHDGTVSANDCFRPVSRYFDRIVHPEQLLTALPRAMHVLTDAALCGPVTLALPQDVQTMAFDYPGRVLRAAAGALRRARRRATTSSPTPRPLAAQREAAADRRRRRRAVRARQRRAARVRAKRMASRSPRRRPARARCRGTTRCSSARSASPARRRRTRSPRTRTSCSPSARGCRTSRPARTRCSRRRSSSAINVNGFDALKWRALPLRRRCAPRAARRCRKRVAGWRADAAWHERARDARERLAGRRAAADRPCATAALPYDGDVIGAVQRSAADSPRDDIVVCAAGTLPGRAAQALAHVGAGRLPRRVRLLVHGLRDRRRARREDGAARPRGRRDGRRRQLPDAQLRDRDVGDARPQARRSSCSTTAATAASTGCSRRSAASRSTTCSTIACRARTARRAIDFAAHARSLGAHAEHVKTIAELEAALKRARAAERTYVVCDRHRSRAHDRRRRTVVGGRRAGGLRARRSRRRARKQYEQRTSGGRSHEREHELDETSTCGSASTRSRGATTTCRRSAARSPLETALSEGKAIGYEGFELGNKFPREPTGAARVLGAHGLALVSGWYSGRLARALGRRGDRGGRAAPATARATTARR